MKESETTYAYLIEHMEEPTFDKVRRIAYDFVRQLPLGLGDELHNKLNRGVDLLDSDPLMQMYLYSYGCMHAEKLLYAFQNMDDDVKSAEMMDIIDYGCGQGLGTLCYHDFLSKNSSHQQIRSITLIEPSSPALARAELLCSQFFPKATIISINKDFNNLTTDDLKISEDVPTLHIFSNVIDLETFDIIALAEVIKSSRRGDNDFIIVSPMLNPQQLQLFAEHLDCNCYFKKYLDKNQLRADKDWTCSVLLLSTRKEKIAQPNYNEAYKRGCELLNDVTKGQNKTYCKQVFDEVLMGAEHGNAECENLIGVFYNRGVVVKKNYEQAIEWYKTASEHGYAKATCNLARMYAKGTGINKDLKYALVLAESLKEKAPKLYYYVSGFIHIIASNHKLAIEFFTKGAELKDSACQFALGCSLFSGKYCDKDEKRGIEYIQAAAEQEYDKALDLMGRFYEDGCCHEYGIAQSDVQAMAYYKKGAIKGVTAAQLKLGDIYRDGLLGMRKDPAESFKWCLFAAEKGNIEASFNVGHAYSVGDGTSQNYKRAVQWYTFAADNGSVAAMNNLAICYEKGNGVEKDINRAWELYEKAAVRGNKEAMNNLSICYKDGTGVDVSPEKALFWKEKAALEGHKSASEDLAKWYYIGYGTSSNKEKALYWHIKSVVDIKDVFTDSASLRDFIKQKANENEAFFQYILAKCYDYGVCVDRNQSEARNWYKKSADNGYTEAFIKLRRTDLLKTDVTKDEISKGHKVEGIIYSQDWKKVLSCEFPHVCKIRDGVRIICDGAFAGGYSKIIIPSSVILIGNNPFYDEPLWRDNREESNSIEIENHSNNYFINENALYTKDGSLIISYFGGKKHFEVPQKVECIGDRCFYYSNTIESISLPDSLKTIGGEAFKYCRSLKTIDIPKSVHKIGCSAFEGCEDLQTIWSLGSISTLESRTFAGCNISNIHFPSTLRIIGDNVFNSNAELEIIDLPDSVEEIGDYAFAYCSEEIKSINLGSSIRKIGNFCFYGSNIEQIVLPNTLDEIGFKPFERIDYLKIERGSFFLAKSGLLIDTKNKNLICYFGADPVVNVADIKSISPYAFYGSRVTEIILNNDIKAIPKQAFSQSDLCKITLPQSLEVIEIGAFASCWDLEDITMPEGLKEIHESAFSGCWHIKDIIIPESVREIKPSAFYDCHALESITFEGKETKASENIIEDDNDKDIGFIEEPYMSPFNEYCWHMKVPREIDEDSAEKITVVVPTSSLKNYYFKSILSGDNDTMVRKFEVIEKDSI